ncbi:hypothetical protein C8Q78DRAFT_1071052 [Trametes maxima]|nr:hypothetical protein C8Q78DRAFT_1071052 [Trametes maxima]
MFSAFSFAPVAPFDLPAALKAWAMTNAEHLVPEFKGRPKRKDDLTPDAWLALVEKGSLARSVPKAHWPAVAKHFMGKKARSRVLEVEKVMRALHGEQWDWRWKDFKVAVMNMGWNIEETKTRKVQVERKASGLWWIPGGSKDDAPAQPAPTSKNSTKAVSSPKKALADAKQSNKASSSKSSDSKVLNKSPPPKTAVVPSRESTLVVRRGSLFSLPALPFLRPTPQPQQTVLQTITAQVPLWLLAATEALSTLSNEHPDVLTAVAAALVAVGTVSTGGTAAVAAIGEAAVVVGRALKTAHDRTHSSSR